MDTVKKWIERAKKKGLNNRQLAIKSGIEPTLMSDYKKGKRPMKEKMIQIIAEMCKVEPAIIDIEILAEKRHGKLKEELLAAAKKMVPKEGLEPPTY